jgi:hypothetical protein
VRIRNGKAVIQNLNDMMKEGASMFLCGLLTIMMLQTPDAQAVQIAQATGGDASGYLTLDELIDETESFERITYDVDLAEASKQLSELVLQPPQDKEEYAVAVAHMMTMPVAELFSFAQYKGTLPVENLGKNIKLGASEVRMASLDIAADIQTVSTYYLQEFYSKGILPKVHMLYANSLYFSYREADGFMRTITLVGFGDQTVAFAAVSDARKVYESVLGITEQSPSKLWDDWREPKHEGAPIVIHNSEAGVVQASRKITVGGKTAEEVMSYYTRELALSGWTMSDKPKKIQESILMMFEKGNRRCSVTIVEGAVGGSFESLTLCQESVQ